MTDFGILGPLEVRQDGRQVELGGRNQRAVLALLLLQANQVVSIDRVAEELYGDATPVTAVTQVHRQVSELRKLLDPSLIETRPPGYLVRVAPGELDLHRFERLTEQAAAALGGGDAQSASEALDEALSLWRGPPLADLAYEAFAQGPIARLEELRLAAVEARIEAQLALGHHPAVVAQLKDLTLAHPLRERLRALMMLALYRSGRQVEALDAYRATRTELVQGFGVEPGPQLQQLEQAILRHDPDLSPSPGDSPAGTVILAGRDRRRLETLLAVAAPLARRPPRELIVSLLVQEEAALTEAAAELSSWRDTLDTPLRTAAFIAGPDGDDILRLAQSQNADLLLLDSAPDALPVALLEGSAADVGLLFAPLDPAPAGGGVLVPFGGGEHDWAAVELGAWLATATGERLRLAGAQSDPRHGGRNASGLLADASLAVQRLVGVAAEPALVESSSSGLVNAAEGASAVVVGLSPRWRHDGLGEVRRALVADAGCPVVVVHRGLRPSGIAPRDTTTRFTWSIAGA